MGVLGIALGTTNSAAYFCDGRSSPRIILAKAGLSIYGENFPSYVEFDQTGEPLCVGRQAYDDYCMGTTNMVVWGVNRLIGRSFREAKRELRHLDYLIAENCDDGGILIPVGQRRYAPEDIAAMILSKIRQDATDSQVNSLGEITQVVIGCPAYFDSIQRAAMLRVARAAFNGLPEYTIRLISKPVAVALSCGLEILPAKPAIACIIDLGADTLDIVTAALSREQNGTLDIMADPALGNAAFGGIDIDRLLMDWVIREYGFAEFERIRRAGGIYADDEATRELHQELKRLRSEVEKAKIRLSNPKVRQREMDIVYKGEMGVVTLTREKLEEALDASLPRERVDEFFGYSLSDEEMSKVQQALKEFHPSEKRKLPSLLDILRITIKSCLDKGNYRTQDIDHVLLVGGPMHMPCIRKAIRQVFAANEDVVRELERIEQEGFPVPVDRVDCVARGASLIPEEPRPMLNFYYALVTGEEEKDGKTYVYYDDKSLIRREDSVPRVTKVERRAICTRSEAGEIPITLLQGKEDTTIPSRTRILWKKSMTYSFKPAYDSEGKANYTITLAVDKDQIVNCIVEDKVSKKKYSLTALGRQIGEVLEPKKYEVLPEVPHVIVEQLRGLSGFLDYLSLLAIAWLTQKHSIKEEQNRAKIRELTGLIPLHRSNLEPVIKKYEGFPDDHEITDPADLSVFYQAVATVQELHQLPHYCYDLRYEDVEAARDRAQSLLPYVNQLRDKPGGDAKLCERMLKESRELEEALLRLPHKNECPPLPDKLTIANWADVKNLAEILKSTINALRQSLGMPPIGY